MFEEEASIRRGRNHIVPRFLFEIQNYICASLILALCLAIIRKLCFFFFFKYFPHIMINLNLVAVNS